MSTIGTSPSAVTSPTLSSYVRAPLRIEPSRRWTPWKPSELWEHRELLYFLTWRDVKIRYKQTLLGVAWAVLQPLATVAIFSVFFGMLARLESDGVPYPVFAFAGLLPWNFFQGGLSQAANSLVGNANLLTKVYFPRLLLPLANVACGLVDFACAFVVLLGLMAVYGIAPSWRMLCLPLPLAVALTASLGAGLWLSALNVQFRDVRHTVPFLLQVWMYATPIVYPSSLVPESWRLAYAVNPMVGVVEWFRWAIVGAGTLTPATMAVSCASALVLLATGACYFRAMERTFADVV